MRVRRIILASAGACLLVAALLRIEPLSGGQAAVSLSRPGHEDLSFWVNHNGLQELDVEGEAGFGDMARLLMRRRSNRDLIRGIRDRFTFRSQEMEALDTPDLFRLELRPDGPYWQNEPGRYVVAAGRIFNLPLVIVNGTGQRKSIEAATRRKCSGGGNATSVMVYSGPCARH